MNTTSRPARLVDGAPSRSMGGITASWRTSCPWVCPCDQGAQPPSRLLPDSSYLLSGLPLMRRRAPRQSL